MIHALAFMIKITKCNVTACIIRKIDFIIISIELTMIEH